MAPTRINAVGTEVVDIVCPLHPQITGECTPGYLGKTTCGLIFKSHKTIGPDEGLEPGTLAERTVVDEACEAIMIPVGTLRAAKAPKATRGEK